MVNRATETIPFTIFLPLSSPHARPSENTASLPPSVRCATPSSKETSGKLSRFPKIRQLSPTVSLRHDFEAESAGWSVLAGESKSPKSSVGSFL